MPNDKEKLLEEMQALRAQFDEIEEEENRVRYGGLTGKCFGYRNCYSCPEKPSDYWYTYVQVLSVEGSYVNALCFDIDKDGRVSIDPSKTIPAAMLGRDYKSVTKARFDKARRRCLKTAEHLLREAQ